MKRWMVLLFFGMAGVLHASNNPFELKPGLQHLESDVNDLIGDLKSLQSDEDEFDDEEIGDDEEDVDEEDVDEEGVDEEDTTVDEARANEERMTETTDNAEATAAEEDASQETSNAEEIAQPASSLEATSEAKKEASESSEAVSEKKREQEAEKEVVEIEKLAHDDAGVKRDDAKASEETMSTEKASDPVSPSQKRAKSAAPATETVQVHTPSVPKAVQPTSASEPEQTTAPDDRREPTHTVEEAKPNVKMPKAAAPQKPEKLTIESIMNSGGANVDIEKEREEAAKRAEEELRKAIAAVDQED